MKKSGLTSSHLPLNYISSQHIPNIRCLCGAKGCRKYLNWATCAAQPLDNLYLKTLCKPTAVISALMYNCTCTIAALPLQGFTIVHRPLFRKTFCTDSIGLNIQHIKIYTCVQSCCLDLKSKIQDFNLKIVWIIVVPAMYTAAITAISCDRWKQTAGKSINVAVCWIEGKCMLCMV